MLLTKEVFVEISGKNKSLYQSLGYNIPEVWDKKHKSYSTPRGTKITILIEHLAKGSHEYVEVECDYCGKIIKKMYKEYLRRHDEELGDCCHKCEGIKYKRTMKEKYGVNHPFEVDEFKQKVKQTNQLKYGCDWQQQNPQVQEKSRIATVVAVGKGRKCHDGSIQEIEVKVGDRVFLSHYAGDNDDVTYNGEELTIVDEGQILAVIE